MTASSFEEAQEAFLALPFGTQVIIGIGGGKALDTAKYVAFLAGVPYIACPTALSNDSFCSPQASLDIKGKKKVASGEHAVRHCGGYGSLP